MELPHNKNQSIADQNIKYIRSLPCSVCSKPPPNDCHHWKTKGSGGSDCLSNLVTLCRKHHAEFHQKGRATFLVKYFKHLFTHRLCYELPMDILEDESTVKEFSKDEGQLI